VLIEGVHTACFSSARLSDWIPPLNCATKGIDNMKLKTLRQTLTIGVIAAAALTSVTASAAPLFTFTEAGGFVKDPLNPTTTTVKYGINTAGINTGSNGMAGVNPTSDNTFHDISWGVGAGAGINPSSGMNLQTFGGALGTSWTKISTLSHSNNVILTAISWLNQDVLGRFIITDNNGASSVVLDSTDPITLDFTETPNANCVAPNPNGSTCDDYYAFTVAGLNSIKFTANDSTSWFVDFALGNFVNSMFVSPNRVYTAEGKISSVDVLASVRQIPEPATLFLMGLGLVGFGIAGRRKSV
jgi:hypothetical protein